MFNQYSYEKKPLRFKIFNTTIPLTHDEGKNIYL